MLWLIHWLVIKCLKGKNPNSPWSLVCAKSIATGTLNSLYGVSLTYQWIMVSFDLGVYCGSAFIPTYWRRLTGGVLPVGYLLSYVVQNLFLHIMAKSIVLPCPTGIQYGLTKIHHCGITIHKLQQNTRGGLSYLPIPGLKTFLLLYVISYQRWMVDNNPGWVPFQNIIRKDFKLYP